MDQMHKLTREELKWIFDCSAILKRRKIEPSQTQVNWLYMLLVASESPEEAVKIVFGEGNAN